MSTAATLIEQPPMIQLAPETETLYLCSVYPKELIWKSRFRSPVKRPDGSWGFDNLTIYRIPAAEKGSYSVIPIYPAQQYTQGQPVEIDGTDGEMKLTRQVAFVNPKDIADSIINAIVLADVHYGGREAHIGLAVIAGPEPTPEELERLNAIQMRYFERLVAKGTNELYNIGDPQSLRQLQEGSSYWLAAKHIGANVEWMRPLAPKAGIKSCIACGENMPLDRDVCAKCSRDLVTYAQQRRMTPDEVRAKGDEYTAQALERLEGTVAAKAPVATPKAESAAKAETIGERARKAAAKKD